MSVTTTVSIYLDLVRVIAALLVAYGHMTQSFFSSGGKDRTFIATMAVGVFFTLSGFVIRHVVAARDRDAKTYVIARLARMYSVLVPALILSVAVSWAGAVLDPDFYRSWAGFSTFPVLRMLGCLLFVNEAYGIDASPFSDSPVWSLGYEVPFYFVFGAMFFARRWLRVCLLLGSLALWGPNIFVLFPTWLSGVWLYGFLRKHTIPRWIGACCAVLAGALAMLYLKLIYPNQDAIRSWIEPIWWLRDRYTPHFPIFYLVGILVCLSLLTVRAFDREIGWLLIPLAKPIRGFASATFSIYLFHFPLLVFAYLISHYDRSSSPARSVVFVCVIAACVLLSSITEARKAMWARWLRWMFRVGRNSAAKTREIAGEGFTRSA